VFLQYSLDCAVKRQGVAARADFCAALLKALKANGVHTAVDTCGFVAKESLEKVIPYTDIFLYDLKAYDSETHKKCTGHSNGRILENLRFLDEKGCKIEIRIPFVPDYNDQEMEKIGVFLKDLKGLTKVRVLPYHNYAGSKYRALGIDHALPDRLPTDTECTAAREHLRAMGLRVVE
jgi:pyruvate formate lyase activating enzyme